MVSKVLGLGARRTAEGKLRPPALGRQVVERPRLRAVLDGMLESPGTFSMLSAPAGFGKTWLLAQWAQSLGDRGVATGWCTLTVDDRDPVVLWNTILDSLIDAAGCSRPDISLDLATLEPDLSPLGHSAFLSRLYDLVASFTETIVVIVDDACVLDGSDAAPEFIALLKSMPDNLHLAFATRSPLQNQSARLDGRLLELSADSLSFSLSETAELIALAGSADAAATAADHATAVESEQLHDRVEGWPIALSLALMSAQKLESAPAVISTWDDPSVLFEYLRREVFDDLGPDERRVMLTLGVTPLTTPELADTLGGGENSAAVMRELAMSNRLVFRVPDDIRGRHWYRVQKLFGAFLREQLREEHPSRVREMTAKAAAWHIDHGEAFAALRLALDIPDAGLVDMVLRRRGYELVGEGHARELLDLMPAATNDVVQGPFARLILAYAAAASAKPERAEEFLATPHVDSLSVDDLLEWDWLNYLVRLQLALGSGKPIEPLSSGWDEESLADVSDPLRLAIRLCRGLVEAKGGRATRARENLSAALALAENDEDLSTMALGTLGLAGSAAGEGDFRAVLSFSQQALSLIGTSPGAAPTNAAAVAHGLAAWASFELLDTAAAREHASTAVDLAAHSQDEIAMLQAKHIFDDTQFDVLPQKRRVAQEFVTAWPPAYLRGAAPTTVMASVHGGLRMAAHLGEPRWSERLLDRARQLVGEGYDWQVAYALHLLQTGRDDAARTVVGPLVDGDQILRAGYSPVIATSIDAVLKSRSNNEYLAHSAMYQSLELADAKGAYFEASRSDQQTVARILSAGIGRFGPHEHIARQLLAGDTGESVLASGPLTARERQILAELRTLRTVEEIAHDLLLSVNTVKTHMRGIYRKLDVVSRRQAVIKAERYGLI